MSKFKDWFEQRLVVGGFPFMVNVAFFPAEYGYIINVSDEWYNISSQAKRTHWFPMSEGKRDMGLNSIYGAIVILRQAEQENARVYLHCHAGSNRSPTVQAAYYYFRTGEQYQEKERGRSYMNAMLANCSRGYLPPKAEMEAFLTELRKGLADDTMKPGTLSMAKIETINNF